MIVLWYMIILAWFWGGMFALGFVLDDDAGVSECFFVCLSWPYWIGRTLRENWNIQEPSNLSDKREE